MQVTAAGLKQLRKIKTLRLLELGGEPEMLHDVEGNLDSKAGPGHL